MTPSSRRNNSKQRSERIAFGVIKALSVLTIVVLGLIIGFILWKGLRYSSDTRSTVLPYEEAAPDGLAVAVNSESLLKKVEFPVLFGVFTDEYIDWSKIDAEDLELLPLAVDPATPEGTAAAKLVFGAGRTAAYGGLVSVLPTAEAVAAKVASTPGAIAILPEAAVRGNPGIAVVRLRRISLVANADALALTDNRQVEDLSDGDISSVALGETRNWSSLGGPDLPVRFMSPPKDSPIAATLASAGMRASGEPSPDMATYLGAIASQSGAVGFVFAEDVPAGAQGGSAGDEGGLGLLTRKGVERGWNLTPSYLVEAPRLSGRVGGISTIIINTFSMLLLTLLIAAPIGVAAAVYLVEYARQGPLVRILRLGTETLAGIPSIIFGLFGMLFFVNILHFGFGLLSGCLTLTLMILPTIVRTSEEALKSVPKTLREGSLALGATKLQTVSRVVIPAAAPGILTGLILGIGRAVGETAALLFTMGSDYKVAKGLFSSARVLSAHIYLLFAEGISFDRAFSTAAVLILIVLLFNFAAKRLVGRMSRNSAL
jgi:phosphate transport system permease protein